MTVVWGLGYRDLGGVAAIGIDEICWLDATMIVSP